jgi:hypothetical protein
LPECQRTGSRCAERNIPGDGAGGSWLPWLGISARRDDRISSTIRDGVVASAHVVCAVRGHAANVLIARDLVEHVRQHRCVPGIAPRDLDWSDFQCFLINADVSLTPYAPFWPAMLAWVPFAFTLNLDAGAVDQQVQRARRAAIRNEHRKRPLTWADGAEVRHVPIESC